MRLAVLLLLSACRADDVKFPGDDDTGDTDTDAVDTDTGPGATDSAGDSDTAPPDTDTGPGDTDTAVPDTDTDAPDTAEPYVPVERTTADAALVLVGTDRYGYSGNSVSAAGDLDGDGLPDLVIGAFNETTNTDFDGAFYLVTAADLAAADPTTEHEIGTLGRQLVGGEGFSGAGDEVAGGHDVDGDGQPDVVVAGFRNGYGDGFMGVYVYWTPATGAGEAGRVDEADVTFACDASKATGSADFGGDPDGDGRRDVLAGCPWDGTGGVVYVVDAGTAGALDPTDATTALDAELPSYYAGESVEPLGDVDGDGLDDFGVGGFGHDRAVHGTAWIVVDHDAGSYALGDQAHTIVGENGGDLAGVLLLDAGDVDGDGLADVAVASPGSDVGAATGGSVSFVTGHGWRAGSTTALPDGVSLVVYGTEVDGYFGVALASAGDVDGDGERDFLFGDGAADGWVYHGPVGTGSVAVSTVADRYTGMARAMAGLGDLDADGFDDLAFGDPYADTSARGGGKTYLFHGAAR